MNAVNKQAESASIQGDHAQPSIASTAAGHGNPSASAPSVAPAQDDLVVRARGGDKKAFERLVSATYDRAYTVALHMLRSEADARDIVQDAYIRVQRGLRDFQGNAKFSTWLYRVVVNLCIDQLRHKKRWDNKDADALDDLQYDGASPEALTADTETAKVLAAGLATLPEIHRATFLLFEVEGLSYEDIAAATGVRVGTVMSRLFYARKKMREFVINQVQGPATPGKA